MALHAGVSHKAMIPVGGVPMLLRVVRTLLETPCVGRIVISIERPDLVRDHAELGLLLAGGRIEVMEAAGSPSRSVGLALDQLGTPLLVTTADHALLRPEWLEHFWRHVPPGADVAAGLARAEVVQRDVPGTQRTYLRFADGAFSGCNMFAFRTPAARALVETWQRVERERKKPWKLVALLGPWSVLRFLLGRLTLADALTRLARITGAKGAVVEMPFGRAAVDVDKPADLELAERLLVP